MPSKTAMVIDSEDDFDFDSDNGSDNGSDFDFDQENIPANKPKKAITKSKAKVTKKSTTKAEKKKKETKKPQPIESDDDDNNDDDDIPDYEMEEKKSKSGKTVEQIYQKKTQLEHILLRPDTYIGAVEPVTQQMFIFDAEANRIVQREITFTPGLFKIFDEIVVNASDNKQRDSSMDRMEITIDASSNEISVKNNGKGIPVVLHKEHNCYVPTLIFGHLLTGSNFDDDEKKTTGGRNGYGAKLANIFSTKFCIECVDSENGLKLTQVFTNNMHETGKPVIKKLTPSEKKKGDYTKITFSPDLARFKMSAMDQGTVSLLSRRAYDISGSMSSRPGKKLEVYLNGTKVPVKSFKNYLELYDGINVPDAFEKVNDCWEVGVSISDGSFQQISFVNSISTSKGGGHVNYIADQVGKHLVNLVKKKNKDKSEIKLNQIKNHLSVFVNCLVENPAFDSQTKEFLTTRPNAFGSKCLLPEKFLKKLDKSGVVDAILAYAKFKQGEALKRKGGTKKIKLTGIAKLDDANNAGSAKSQDCTLIITEGDSAKSLAMSGLSVIGRDYYGVFPLKGKPLNVRDANKLKVVNNEEIKNVVDIMGLKFGVTYDETNIKSLRYGHLMIMADQDHDGSHIKGLVINFLHNFWPSLLSVPGFLQQFITPIVKATKGKKSRTFFTIPEYEEWKANNDVKGYNTKYYKGLGTSTSAEAKDYFSNLELHEIHFSSLSTDIAQVNDDDDDGDTAPMELVKSSNITPDVPVSGSDLIVMAFSQKKAEQRKTWLNKIEKGIFCDYSKAQDGGLKFSDFINKELILFSVADNQRSIPHMYDGFKPSQRKVLFACIKRKLNKVEIKVAQLAGYIGEHSAYHHGEASLHGTLVGMAQHFVGSNNVNLLTPSGQFGTRRMGGKDSASPRYIFTKLEKITRTIYHPDDDALLSYLSDDGMSIEPEYYMPVIPMVLVNGAEGIGTGWSTKVPNYDPRVIIANIRKLINDDELEKMQPFYYGFSGEIEPESETKFIVKGRIVRIDDTTLQITELPIKVWTQDYKEFLEKLLTGDKDKNIEPDIKDFKENHTDTTVFFTITATKEKIDKFENGKDGLYGKFKLMNNITTTNMHLFDEGHKIVKNTCPEDILKTFFTTRLGFYYRRKDNLLKILRREQLMLSNRARFVEEVCNGDLIVTKTKKAEILSELQTRGYAVFYNENEKKNSSEEEENASDQEQESDEPSGTNLSKGYEYLLGMKIWSLTFEKAEALRAQLAEKTDAVKELELTPPSTTWLRDLDSIEIALDDRDAEMESAAKAEIKAQLKNKNKNSKNGKKKAGARKGKKKDEWDSEMEDSDHGAMDDDSSVEVVKPVKARAKPRAKAAKVTKVPKATKATKVTKAQSLIPDTVTSTPEKKIQEEDPVLLLSAQVHNQLSISPERPSRKSPDDMDDYDRFIMEADFSDTSSVEVVKPVKSKAKPRAKVTKSTKSTKATKALKLTEAEISTPEKKIQEEDPVLLLSAQVHKQLSISPERPTRKSPTSSSPTDDEKEEMSDTVPAAKKKRPPTKRARATNDKVKGKKNRLQKKVIDIESSEDDFEINESDPEEVPSPQVKPTRAGRGGGRAKINYALDDSESEESDGFVIDDDDSD